MRERWLVEKRIKCIKAMHELMCNSNHEGIYMSWTLLFPDEPDEYDYEEIAEDDDKYKECYELFCRLITHKGWL